MTKAPQMRGTVCRHAVFTVSKPVHPHATKGNELDSTVDSPTA